MLAAGGRDSGSLSLVVQRKRRGIGRRAVIPFLQRAGHSTAGRIDIIFQPIGLVGELVADIQREHVSAGRAVRVPSIVAPLMASTGLRRTGERRRPRHRRKQ